MSATTDHLAARVSRLLTYIFTKDKDFQKFCDENGSAKPKTTLRLKRPASTGAKLEQHTKGAKASAAAVR